MVLDLLLFILRHNFPAFVTQILLSVKYEKALVCVADM